MQTGASAEISDLSEGEMLRFAQHDNVVIVTLSAAKGLAADRDRSFAALRMTIP